MGKTDNSIDRGAVIICGIYILMGITWIVVTDWVVAVIEDKPWSGYTTLLQSAKGIFYVLATAIILYYLIRRYNNRMMADSLKREQVQREFVETSRYFQAILENSFDGVALVDRNGKVRYNTPSNEKITGYPSAERLGEHALSLLSTGDKEEAGRFLQQLLSQPGKDVVTVSRIIHRDGTERVLEVHAKSMLDDPIIDGIVINYRDITERFIAEEQLRISEEKYHILFRQNPSPLWIYDLETLHFIDVNEAAIAHYGYSLAEFQSMTIMDIRPPEEAAAMKPVLTNRIGTIMKVGAYSHKKKNGELIKVEVSFSDIDFNGRSCRMLLVHDVTDNIKAQEILRKSEEQYRHLVENLPAGAVSVEGDTIMFNKETERITGYSRGEIKTVEQWFKALYPHDTEQVLKWYKEDQGNGFPESRTVALVRKDGELRWVTFYAYSYDKGEIWLLHDITEQKFAEERIFRSIMEGEDRERQRIASDLHDGLGQQLTAAALNFQGMKAAVEHLGHEKQQQFHQGLNFLNKAIEESRHIAHNLMPMSIEDFGLIFSFESLFNSIRKTANLDISFYHNIGNERFGSQVETNLYRITQECLNNVIKHAHAKQVTVQLVRHPQSLVYTFEDDGAGFDNKDEKLKKVAGMGLHNIYNRVKAMSGELGIDTKPGHGTAITIELKMQAKPVEVL